VSTGLTPASLAIALTSLTFSSRPAASLVAGTTSSHRRPDVRPDDLAQKWGIGKVQAANTLKVTTQRGVRSAIHPLHRRFRTKNMQLRYAQLNCRFYSDTFFSEVKSVRGFSCAQVFVDRTEFSVVYPMKRKGEAPDALRFFIEEVGIPSHLHTDGAPELTQGRWADICRDAGIRTTCTEPHSPWQNRAERNIRELKKGTLRLLQRTGCPARLWDFAVQYVSETRALTALDAPALRGRTPYEVITGRTPDISEYIDFSFYDWLWYFDSEIQFPEQKRKLGRWLGVSHRVGQAMCYWVLPESGKPISRSTVQPLTSDERGTEEYRQQMAAFDRAIKERLEVVTADDTSKGKRKPGDETTVDIPAFLRDTDDPEWTGEYQPLEPEAAMPEADDFDPEAFDRYLTAEVALSRGGGEPERGKVLRRKRNADGDPIGKAHENPLFDTRQYEVEFADGSVGSYTANMIAESLYSVADSEGNHFLMLDELVGHKADKTAVPKEDGYITNQSGHRSRRTTTRGWKLCARWKDGSTSWEALKDLKESYPVQVAEYAIANGLEEEPAFAWWTRHVLKKRDRLIARVKSRYWKRTHKFGIRLPKSVKEALAIDRETGTTFWYDAICKEMKNVRVAFKILEADEKVPVGSKFIPLHMIFDVKMDLTRKARLVAGGHTTDPPPSVNTYSSVVSRESVRIAFLIAALNDLNILAADIGNAYLNAPCRERLYTTAGPEFGSDVGKQVVIVRALYGLRTSGASWHAQLATTMQRLGFTPCMADRDVWMRPAVKPDGFKYYEYVLLYVDDTLVVSHEPMKIMEAIKQDYRLKDDLVEEPTRYLGADIGRFQFADEPDKPRWSMSADRYVREAIANVETELQLADRQLPTGKSTKTPLKSGYRPELDFSPVLNDTDANYFQNLIGVLRWAVELGRLDIYLEVALLSAYNAQPREGHLEAAFHMFAYLKKHPRSRLVFDDTYPDFGEKRKEIADAGELDWMPFYGDVKEQLPPNAPEARGNDLTMTCYVDADHAGNTVTRRSHTGVLIFLNGAPITWYSKRQTTVETSTFGSEFIAARIATELVEGLRYKLRMMGIPIAGPALLLCDNASVVANASRPDSTLKKKHNSIAYHRVREAAAAGTLCVVKVGTLWNLADLFTKCLPAQRRKQLLRSILF
jgi:hypothetical protein